MAGAAVRAHAGSGAPALNGKIETRHDNARWLRSNCACGSPGGDKSGRVVMRSSWLGDEDRRRQLRSLRSRRRGGREKGFGGAQQSQVRAGFEELLHNQARILVCL